MSTLPQRTFGTAELAVTTLGLGCNNLGRTNAPSSTFEGSLAVVDAALDAGITFFDVADNYGAQPGLSEEFLGRALGSRRTDVVVATKFGMDTRDPELAGLGPRGGRAYVRAAVEGSLRRLGTDWIDLYQYHTPDGQTPVDETLGALDELVIEGKVRFVGHSNFAGWQFGEAELAAARSGSVRFVSAQNHFNLLDRRAELEVLPAARAFGLGVLPYFPLANGLLTGKYSGGARPADGRLVHSKPHELERAPWEKVERLEEFCAARGISMVALAIGWLLAQEPVTSVIAGATRASQVKANAAAATWTPTPEDLAALDEISPSPSKIALF
ncbi:MAG: aldo/keto reductase [Actinomycetota bacterium]|nr:aldo/keto reductase [Actinomycetota bacterium]